MYAKQRRLKNVISILQHSTTKDTVGGPVVTFTTLATVFADFQDKSGSEPVKDTKETGIKNTIFWIRHRTDLDKKMKISFRNKVFDILQILEEGRRHYMKVVTQQIEVAATTTGITEDKWLDTTPDGWITPGGETWIWKQ